MADAIVTMKQGERNPAYGEVIALTGTVQITDPPTCTLKDSGGDTVSGYDGILVTGYDTAVGTFARAWLNINTLSPTVLDVGTYTLEFSIPVTGSDSIARVAEPEVALVIIAAFPVRVSRGCTRTAYPDGDDLKDYMLSTNLISVYTPSPFITATDWDSVAAAGVDDFEELVGRVMLGFGDSTRLLDPPYPGWTGTMLRLGDDLCSVTSVKVGGVSLERDRKYRLLPRENEYKNLPWSLIEFIGPQPQTWANLEVTGCWARAQCLPDNAFWSMVRMGARRLLPTLGLIITQGLQSWNEADVSESYGQTVFGWWYDQYDRIDFGDPKLNVSGVVTGYKRVAVGV